MLRRFTVFLGRFCLSLIFLSSAVSKCFNWSETEQYVTGQLRELANTTTQMSVMQDMTNFALEFSEPLLIFAAGLELLGALSLLLGLGPRIGALFLILFLIPTTIVAHHFWLLTGPGRDLQMVMFLKNVGILGGLFLVLGMGSAKSKDCKPE